MRIFPLRTVYLYLQNSDLGQDNNIFFNAIKFKLRHQL